MIFTSGEYTMRLADLYPLSPLLTITASVIWVMMAIGARRNYPFALGSTLLGLGLTALAAFMVWRGEPLSVLQIGFHLFTVVVDGYALFFIMLTCLAAAGLSVIAHDYWSEFDDQREEFLLLLLLATLGAVVLAMSAHFATFLLGLETLSMSLYGMLAYPVHSRCRSGNNAKALESAVKYLILSAVSTAMILFGVALIYAETGSLAFNGLADLPVGPEVGFSVVALLLLAAGVAFKLSLFPFHIWTPDVYEGAPVPATAYLATIGKLAVFIVLLRVMLDIRFLGIHAVAIVFSLLALLSIIAGNLLALLQDNLKRILAYSSIAHMGYLLIALIAAFIAEGTISVEAVSFYLFAYVIMTLGAFGIVSLLSSDARERDDIADYQGLFWRRPWLAAAFTGMLLSLAGIPLTAGFIGKFYLVLAGVESGQWLLLGALIVGSGIGLYYYLRIVYRMLLPAPADAPELRVGNAASSVVLVLFVLIVLFGVYPASLMSLIQGIAL